MNTGPKPFFDNLGLLLAAGMAGVATSGAIWTLLALIHLVESLLHSTPLQYLGVSGEQPDWPSMGRRWRRCE